MTKITTESPSDIPIDQLHKAESKVIDWVLKRRKVTKSLHIKFNKNMTMASVIVDQSPCHMFWKGAK